MISNQSQENNPNIDNLSGLDDEKKKKCDKCNGYFNETLVCSRCKKVSYCGKDC